MKRLGKSERRIETLKKPIVYTILFSILTFLLFMGITAFMDSLKQLPDLTCTKGIIDDVYFIKHERRQKFKIIIEDVLVLSIEGTNQKFGFAESSEAYRTLIGIRKSGKPGQSGRYRQGQGRLRP